LYRDSFYVKPEEEERLINVAIDKLQQITGDKTLPHGAFQGLYLLIPGWFSDRRSNMTVQLTTRAHAERDLPLSYSSDSCADELPYWRAAPGGREGGLLMVPFSYDCSDIRFNARGSGWASPADYVAYLVSKALDGTLTDQRDTFDVLWEEGEEGEGKMMTVLLHPHIIGRAGRTKYFEE
jgi:peptidoglycan/xylan/chitin deacetylase (PgdA/CDA1 family)